MSQLAEIVEEKAVKMQRKLSLKKKIMTHLPRLVLLM